MKIFVTGTLVAAVVLGCNSISLSNSEQADKNIDVTCDGILNAYPFSKNSDSELSPYDFNRYFSPGGIYYEYAVEFNQRDSTSKEALKHLEYIKNLHNVFYSEPENRPSFSIKIKTHRGPQEFDSAQLYLGDDLGPSMLGPRFYHDYTWSPESEAMEIRLVHLREELTPLRFDGPWSLFRFLDAGTVRKHPNGGTILSVPVYAGTNYEYQIQGYERWMKIRKNFRCP